MFWNKKKNNNVEEIEQTEETEKKSKVGSFGAIKDLVGMIFRKREYKVEARNITKEDKIAAGLTILIVLAIGLILWFLPFTHKFIEDIIFFRA